MPRYLVSGIPRLVHDVASALREHGAEAIEVDDIEKVPAACATVPPRSLAGYVQLPATFTVRGGTAVERVHHFFSAGVLARFPAVGAALLALADDARLTFVMGVLPPEVSTEDDVRARASLVRVLGHAARADHPDGLRVHVLGADTPSQDIALTALGRRPELAALTADFTEGSYADWRVELLGLMQVQG
jgi:hypothetical protein